MNFADLLLSEPILRSVVSEGYTVATPVQAEAIPHALRGRDIMGCAQTGTGKTAAFALPILHRLSIVARPGGSPKARCLVLCPTRELATQIGQSFAVYGRHVGLRHTIIFGGVGAGPQIQSLRRGVDIIIATPGRLLDLMGQGCVDLRAVEVLVLDEADRMLDMGFIKDIRSIISAMPTRRQTLMFSATMPPDIRHLASAILQNPVTVQVAAENCTADRIDQSVYFVDRADKPALLAHLVDHLPMSRTIAFTRTKHGADRLVRRLSASGIVAEAIHGNKTQNARQRALNNFRHGKTPVLVATDVASRGIDVDGISHVVNYDITDEPETYVHRIGRTARAGASGVAVSFCDPEERPQLRAIEKLLRRQLTIRTSNLPPGVKPAPEHYDAPRKAPHRGAPHRGAQHRPAQHRGAAPRATAPHGAPPRHSHRPNAAPQHAQNRPAPQHQSQPKPTAHQPHQPRRQPSRHPLHAGARG